MLHIAAKLAEGGKDRNFRLGCVAKRNDGALVFSRNERTKTPHPMAHAEARVLKKVDAGSTLWVARITADCIWSLAKPCPRCQAYIISKKVYKVYYTIGPNEYGIWYPMKEEIANYKANKEPNNCVWEEC